MTHALAEWIGEALAPIGTVTSRAMMGGRTLYCDGMIFAILALGELWFKADAASDPIWDAAGCARFSYPRGDGTAGTMNYRRAPDEVHDDADAMRRWAALGLESGRRGGGTRRRRQGRGNTDAAALPRPRS